MKNDNVNSVTKSPGSEKITPSKASILIANLFYYFKKLLYIYLYINC